MDIFIYQLFAVAGIHALAVISPGPDFLLISRYSLSTSKRIAIIAALGIAFGILIHSCLALFGISYLISKSHLAYVTLQYLGSGYLLYLGYGSLRSGLSSKKIIDEGVQLAKGLTEWRAFVSGFMTNVLNPKAVLFFLAIFTQVIANDTPVYIKAVFGLEMTIATFCWFTLVAIVFSAEKMRKRILSYQKQIDIFFGIALCCMAIFVLFR